MRRLCGGRAAHPAGDKAAAGRGTLSCTAVCVRLGFLLQQKLHFFAHLLLLKQGILKTFDPIQKLALILQCRVSTLTLVIVKRESHLQTPTDKQIFITIESINGTGEQTMDDFDRLELKAVVDPVLNASLLLAEV
jgi:hypothetical protein